MQRLPKGAPRGRAAAEKRGVARRRTLVRPLRHGREMRTYVALGACAVTAIGLSAVACQGSAPAAGPQGNEPTGRVAERLMANPVYQDPADAQAVFQPDGTFLTVSDLNQVVYVEGNKYPRSAQGIQAAIAAVPTGGTVHLTTGTYGLSCSGSCTETILINKPLTLEGDGWGEKQASGNVTVTGTVLIPDSNLPPSVSVIHLLDPGGGVTLRNFAIQPAAVGGGQHAIFIDAQVSAGIFSALIDHLNIQPLNATGASIAAVAASGIGGFYESTFQNSILRGGILLENVNDTIRVFNNTIESPMSSQPVIRATNNVGGPSSLEIQYNRINVSSGGGVLLGTNVVGARFQYNDVTASGSPPYLVKVDNQISISEGNLIAGNNFNVPKGVTTTPVLVNGATGTVIKDNRFVNSSALADITLNSVALSSVVESNVDDNGVTLTDNSYGMTHTVTTASNINVGGVASANFIEGRGTLFAATAAACLASGAHDRFILWAPASGSTQPSCDSVCNAVVCGTTQASCVEGWAAFTSNWVYQYGVECFDGAFSPQVNGETGLICCCTGTNCGQPLVR
jgi:hypothetical protein